MSNISSMGGDGPDRLPEQAAGIQTLVSATCSMGRGRRVTADWPTRAACPSEVGLAGRLLPQKLARLGRLPCRLHLHCFGACQALASRLPAVRATSA